MITTKLIFATQPKTQALKNGNTLMQLLKRQGIFSSSVCNFIYWFRFPNNFQQSPKLKVCGILYSVFQMFPVKLTLESVHLFSCYVLLFRRIFTLCWVKVLMKRDDGCTHLLVIIWTPFYAQRYW